MISRADRMSNEHARTENVRNSKDLRAKDKGPEAGFLARSAVHKAIAQGVRALSHSRDRKVV